MTPSELDHAIEKAKQLRDQVLKTWSPPLRWGTESPADIAQTAVMQTLQWCFHGVFDDVELTESQEAAIRESRDFFENAMNGVSNDPI